MKILQDYPTFLRETLDPNLKRNLGLVDKETGILLQAYLTKLDKLPTLKQAQNPLKETCRRLNDNFGKVLATNPDQATIEQRFQADFTAVYTLLTQTAQKFGVPELSPENLYQATNNALLKKIFVQPDMKKFQAQLPTQVKALVAQLSKGNEIKENLVLEAEVVLPAPGQQVQTQAGTPNPQAKYYLQLKNFMQQGFYGPLTKKIDEVVGKVKPPVQAQSLAKKIPASTNQASKRRLLQSFQNIKDPQTLAKVRDTLIANKVLAPGDATTMKF